MEHAVLSHPLRGSTQDLKSPEVRLLAAGEEDTARTLGLSLRTVEHDCLKARAWLYRQLGGGL